MRGILTGRAGLGFVLALILAAAISPGCVTTSCLTSPNVLPEDGFAYTLGFTTIQELGVGSPIMAFRWGVGDGVDIGGGIDMLTTKLDVRYQFLRSERHFLDGTVEAGMGVLFMVFPTYFVGVGLGVDIGPPERGISPYVNYRWTSLSLIETSELEAEDDDDDFDFADIDGWGQVTVGVEIRLSEKVAIVGEMSMLTDLETPEGEELTTLSVGFRIMKF